MCVNLYVMKRKYTEIYGLWFIECAYLIYNHLLSNNVNILKFSHIKVRLIGFINNLFNYNIIKLVSHRIIINNFLTSLQYLMDQAIKDKDSDMSFGSSSNTSN